MFQFCLRAFHKINRSKSSTENHFTRCTKTASKFILYCSDIEQAKPRCTALEDRSGIDPVTQSKELHTFYAKINSVSVTEQKKHKSKRDKIWTCAFFQPNPNCCQLLAAFWSINSFQLVQWSPFYLLVQRRLLTAAVNAITFWYREKKTELHLKLCKVAKPFVALFTLSVRCVKHFCPQFCTRLMLAARKKSAFWTILELATLC